jgi:fimbrial chaperone protein
MRLSLYLGASLGLLSTAAWGSRFNLNQWILVFEPQNKVISHTVTFNYQSDAPPPPQKSGGQPQPPGETDNAPVPVEINIAAREITPTGQVIYPSTLGSDDFVVYPSQFILYPGDSKKVQIQWVGAIVPGKEISFGFISTQLPLDIKKDRKEKPTGAKAVVNLATRYEGVIVVRPAGIKPDVVVDTAYSRKDSAGMSLVTVLNNKGTGMQSLKGMGLTLVAVDKNGKLEFSQRAQIKDIKPQATTNQSLFAGFKRMVVVPWPDGFPVGPVKATAAFPNAKK